MRDELRTCFAPRQRLWAREGCCDLDADVSRGVLCMTQPYSNVSRARRPPVDNKSHVAYRSNTWPFACSKS